MYESDSVVCVAAYDPHEQKAIGAVHEGTKGKDVRDIDPLVILELHDEKSIDVWIWALEEARKMLRKDGAE